MDSTYVMMRVKGVSSNEHTYSALIDGYGKLGMVERAEAILDEMIKAGTKMNVIAYTSIINAYGSAERFLLGLWRMKAFGSNYRSYSSSAELAEQARRWFRQIQHDGVFAVARDRHSCLVRFGVAKSEGCNERTPRLST